MITILVCSQTQNSSTSILSSSSRESWIWMPSISFFTFTKASKIEWSFVLSSSIFFLNLDISASMRRIWFCVFSISLLITEHSHSYFWISSRFGYSFTTMDRRSISFISFSFCSDVCTSFSSCDFSSFSDCIRLSISYTIFQPRTRFTDNSSKCGEIYFQTFLQFWNPLHQKTHIVQWWESFISFNFSTLNIIFISTCFHCPNYMH